MSPRWFFGLAFFLGVAALLLMAATAEERTRLLVVNTLVLVGGTCAVSLPLGVLLGLLATRTDMPGRRAAMFLLGLMLFVPLYLQSAAWQAGFATQGVFTFSGILRGMPAAIWIHAMAATAWVALIVAVGLRWVEPELEQDALTHASPAWVLLHVTMRRAAAAIGVAALWVGVSTAGEMTVTDLFQVRTYAEEVYTQFRLGTDPADAALGQGSGVLASLLLVVAAIAIGLYFSPSGHSASTGRRWTFRLNRWRIPAVIFTWTVLAILVGVPLFSLLYKAGVEVSGAERIRTWSAEKCLGIVAGSPSRHARELGWSVGVGVVVATSAVAIAVLLAWFARHGGWRRVPLVLVIAACMAVPAPLVGLALIWGLNRPEVPLLTFLYDQSIAGLWAAQLVQALPLTTMIVWHALGGVSRAALDSAEVEGAAWPTRRMRIALPIRLPALGIAWLVALALAMGELDAGILVCPPRATTLPIRIFGLLHYGVEDHVAGICLALLLLLTTIALVVIWILRRGPPRFRMFE